MIFGYESTDHKIPKCSTRLATFNALGCFRRRNSLIHAQTSLIRKLQDFSGILVVVSKGHMTSDALIAVGFADIVIAQDQATFSFPEVKRGLVPGMVSLAAKQRLPEHACRRLMLTGEQIDVPVAMKLGLVDFVVDDTENLDAVFERKLSTCLTMLQKMRQRMSAVTRRGGSTRNGV